MGRQEQKVDSLKRLTKLQPVSYTGKEKRKKKDTNCETERHHA